LLFQIFPVPKEDNKFNDNFLFWLSDLKQCDFKQSDLNNAILNSPTLNSPTLTMRS